MALLEHAGAVVTRDELHQRLWKSQEFVNFDQGLNTAMMRLRNALDDRADTPRFIEVLPRQGYRFIAPVSFSHEATPPEKEMPESPSDVLEGESHRIPDRGPERRILPLTSSRRRRAGIITVASAIAVVLLAIGFTSGGFRALLGSLVGDRTTPTLAVLPFDSLSNDPSQNLLAEGMTEHLITELGKQRELRIVSRGSVMQFSGKHLPLNVVAKQLHANYVLEGSVSESAGRLRVTANLYQVATQKHVWAETYERETTGDLSAQREIVLDMARNIKSNLTP